jgi:hypothetical protein
MTVSRPLIYFANFCSNTLADITGRQSARESGHFPEGRETRSIEHRLTVRIALSLTIGAHGFSYDLLSVYIC